MTQLGDNQMKIGCENPSVLNFIFQLQQSLRPSGCIRKGSLGRSQKAGRVRALADSYQVR